jgi:hypothetical protein
MFGRSRSAVSSCNSSASEYARHECDGSSPSNIDVTVSGLVPPAGSLGACGTIPAHDNVLQLDNNNNDDNNYDNSYDHN